MLPSRPPSSALRDRIGGALRSRGLSLAEVSRQTRAGSSNWQHIPHNLYHAIRKRQFSPSIYQVAALSAVTEYRFVDWLELFGFSLDSVARFQARLPALRTVELDSRLYHPAARIPWFSQAASPSFSATLVPLSQWLIRAQPRPADSFLTRNGRAFRFVKIGCQDAFAFPDLLPGSIVRVSALAAENGMAASELQAKTFCLMEYGSGLICSRLHRTVPNRIVLCSRHLPYASVELEEGTQAKILGIADVEIRRIRNHEKPVVPPDFAVSWTPPPFPPRLSPGHVGEFIRRARERSGLSFREAAKRSRLIAAELGDSRYACAPGSLSDYEAQKKPPRHIHKLIAICSVYFASFGELLEAAGLQLDRLGQFPMPAEFRSGKPESPAPARTVSSEFMNEIERRFQPIPYFLHGSLPDLFGLIVLSVRDVFWSGGTQRFVHPCLKGAMFLVVDRRKKVPRPSLSCPAWAQPIFVFQKRDGTYLCGSATRLHATWTIRPSTAGLPKLLRLRKHVDADVVGQVVGIVRKLETVITFLPGSKARS
jgi:transcriptional regulator with XRE-family HTH domain